MYMNLNSGTILTTGFSIHKRIVARNRNLTLSPDWAKISPLISKVESCALSYSSKDFYSLQVRITTDLGHRPSHFSDLHEGHQVQTFKSKLT